MAGQGKVIVIAQQKGGSGKTTLAVNLAVAYARKGLSVALLDTDPQGSLGRWFMTRRERLGDAGLEFSTSSAWGVSYECEKLRRMADVMNRVRGGTRLSDEVIAAAADLDPGMTETRIANRVAYGETLGQGLGIADVHRRGPAATEIAALAAEVGARIGLKEAAREPAARD